MAALQELQTMREHLTTNDKTYSLWSNLYDTFHAL